MVKPERRRTVGSDHAAPHFASFRIRENGRAWRDRLEGVFPRRLLVTSVLALSLLSPERSISEESSAPATVQAQIMARLLPFDRGFSAKVKGEVVIVLLERTGNADSESAVKQISKALSDIGKIGGSPVKTSTVAYSNAITAAAACKGKGAHAVYISPGMGGDSGAIAAAFVGSGIVTFSAVESYVPSGIAVGVAVVGGKPQMSINLAKARAQKIDFPATVLKLAKVY